MPENTPLTKTPYALLADAANIETAGKPGFENLEKYSVPRFSSSSERNSAFSLVTPEVGMLIHVFSEGHLGYQVWDGSKWVEFGEYTFLRDTTLYQSQPVETSSTLFQLIPELIVPVNEGVYRVEMGLHYSTANDTSTTLALNWTFPGSTSEFSVGGMYRGENATGSLQNGTTVGSDVTHGRVSGDAELIVGGTTGSQEGLGNTGYGQFTGILEIKGSSPSGNLQATFRRQGSPGVVRVWRHANMTIRRLS